MPVPRARAHAGRPAALVVLALSALVITACTAAPGPQVQVPTLPPAGSTSPSTAGTPTAGTPTDAGAGRPRLRVDMTTAETQALYQAYNQCLVTNGYNKARNGADQAAMTKAQTACESTNPLPPWELDANNPHAADFIHAVVLCLRAKGVRYVSEGSPQGGRYMLSLGGPGNDPTSISKGMQYAPDCEKQVAAQGIGR
jgi:hypothetical protein